MRRGRLLSATWIGAAVLFGMLSATVFGSEIRLKPQCASRGGLVTLGDVAEILPIDAPASKKLAAIELFPAPSNQESRSLTVRQLQDLLVLKGVNLAEHRFAGASQTNIASAEGPTAASAEIPLNNMTYKRAQIRLQEAVQQYLFVKSGVKQNVIIRLDGDSPLLRAAMNPTMPMQISGGAAPWSGVQRLAATFQTAGGAQAFSFSVQVNEMTNVVAVSRALPKGTLIRDTDVVLVEARQPEDAVGAFRRIEDVVGKQTVGTVANNKILTSDSIQAPSMVHRGDVVTVYACTTGIRVRTTARAKIDGALGDLITVESLIDKKEVYQTRVSGIREAEVLALPVSAERLLQD